MAAIRTYEGAGVRINFDVKRCIHSRNCVLGLPGVFSETGKPWVDAAGAPAAEIAATIRQCPSGALTYEPAGGGAGEGAPAVNRARLWEHGPLEIRAGLTVGGATTCTRAVLCRCGASKNKPWCDNSHRDIAFKATSEPNPDVAKVAVEPAARGGPVAVRTVENGPMNIAGNLEIIAGSGRRIACTTDAWFCRCGASANKPFCDGSHKRIGFQAAGS